jgi:hypothetical protein
MFDKLRTQFRMTKKLGLTKPFCEMLFFGCATAPQGDKKAYALKSFFYNLGERLGLEEDEKKYVWENMVQNRTKNLTRPARLQEIANIKISLHHIILFGGRVIHKMRKDSHESNKFDEDWLEEQISLLKKFMENIFLWFGLEEDEKIILWSMVLQVSENPEEYSSP